MSSTATHTRNLSTTSAKSGHAPAANIKAAHHHAPNRHVVPQPAGYDTTHSLEARKYLKTYGLVPPAVDNFEAQEKRCMQILNSRKLPIDKYQYLSVLRNTNVHLFYRLLAKHVKVSATVKGHQKQASPAGTIYQPVWRAIWIIEDPLALGMGATPSTLTGHVNCCIWKVWLTHARRNSLL
jgi:hypothetical protein